MPYGSPQSTVGDPQDARLPKCLCSLIYVSCTQELGITIILNEFYTQVGPIHNVNTYIKGLAKNFSN